MNNMGCNDRSKGAASFCKPIRRIKQLYKIHQWCKTLTQATASNHRTIRRACTNKTTTTVKPMVKTLRKHE